MNNDKVHLFDGEKRIGILDWPHQWPPWERLAVVVGRQTRVSALVRSPEGIDELSAAAVKIGISMEEMYEITYYLRDSYSRLPEDMGPNVSRGARYVKEETKT